MGRSFTIQNALLNSIQALEYITGRPSLGEILYRPLKRDVIKIYKVTRRGIEKAAKIRKSLHPVCLRIFKRA